MVDGTARYECPECGDQTLVKDDSGESCVGCGYSDIERDYDDFQAEYCENCGQLFEASECIEQSVEEPVHRVELIEAIGPVGEVGESTALEKRECECTGTVVQRWYVYPASEVPDHDYDPDPEDIHGRDPDDDALIDFSGEGEDWQEVREVPWLAEGVEDAEGRTAGGSGD